MTPEVLAKAKEIAREIAAYEGTIEHERKRNDCWLDNAGLYTKELLDRQSAERVDYCQCRIEELKKELDAL